MLMHGYLLACYNSPQGCSGDERQMADYIMPAVSPGREPQKIIEGEETQEFWDSLGGKAEYGSGRWLEKIIPLHPARLFQCSNASGHFKVEEIFDFAQQVSLTMGYSLRENSYILYVSSKIHSLDLMKGPHRGGCDDLGYIL